MLFLSGRANRHLADSVATELDIGIGRCIIENFPDGEVQVRVEEEIAGRDVFILQPTGPPVADNLLEDRLWLRFRQWHGY